MEEYLKIKTKLDNQFKELDMEIHKATKSQENLLKIINFVEIMEQIMEQSVYIIRLSNRMDYTHSLDENRYIIDLFNDIEVNAILRALPEAVITQKIKGNEKKMKKKIENIKEKYDLCEVNEYEYETINVFLRN